MEAVREKPAINTLDDLFGIAPAPVVNVPDGATFSETVVIMPIALIRDFKDHPYRVLNDHITQGMVNDIQKVGRIETPAVIRPLPDGGYEMISGHRRKLACTLAGLESMPVIIRNYTDDEATIAMVSSNRQREEVLPSEKARAYKMWLDAMNRQGERTDLTSATLLQKSGGKTSREIIAEKEGVSHEQVRKFVKLNELIPEILEMVDNDAVKAKDKPTMAFSIGVEISSLPEENQRELLLTMQSEEQTPSVSQAMLMKELSAKGELNMDSIFNIMRTEKPNQVEQFKMPYDRIRQYIPTDFTAKKTEELIVKLLESWHRKRERERNEAR